MCVVCRDMYDPPFLGPHSNHNHHHPSISLIPRRAHSEAAGMKGLRRESTRSTIGLSSPRRAPNLSIMSSSYCFRPCNLRATASAYFDEQEGDREEENDLDVYDDDDDDDDDDDIETVTQIHDAASFRSSQPPSSSESWYCVSRVDVTIILVSLSRHVQ